MSDKVDNNGGDKSLKANDLLIADLNAFADSFWHNEQAGERRVNFLLTLVTAVIAALVALATAKQDLIFDTPELRLIAILALATLLAIGWVTLLRMIRRNCVTEEIKQAMDHVRHHFEAAGLNAYRPFLRPLKKKIRTGGLTDLVAVINSVIVAGLVYLVAEGLGRLLFNDDSRTLLDVVAGLIAVCTAVAAGRWQMNWSTKIRDEWKESLRAARKGGTGEPSSDS